MKQGQETNQIWTQEAGTDDTHNRTLTTIALQVDFLKHLGDVATVLLDLVSVCSVSSCHSRQTDDDQIRSLCGALAVVRQKKVHKLY